MPRRSCLTYAHVCSFMCILRVYVRVKCHMYFAEPQTYFSRSDTHTHMLYGIFIFVHIKYIHTYIVFVCRPTCYMLFLLIWLCEFIVFSWCFDKLLCHISTGPCFSISLSLLVFYNMVSSFFSEDTRKTQVYAYARNVYGSKYNIFHYIPSYFLLPTLQSAYISYFLVWSLWYSPVGTIRIIPAVWVSRYLRSGNKQINCCFLTEKIAQRFSYSVCSFDILLFKVTPGFRLT